MLKFYLNPSLINFTLLCLITIPSFIIITFTITSLQLPAYTLSFGHSVHVHAFSSSQNTKNNSKVLNLLKLILIFKLILINVSLKI